MKKLLVLFCCCAGCFGPSNDPTRDVAKIESAFPEFERLQVREYRKQSWCQVIVSARGEFASNERPTCNYLAKSPVPFDEQARADLESIATVLQGTGVYIASRITYSPQGKVSGGEFDFSAPFLRQSFVYEPGYALPSDMGNEMRFTRINHDWYYVIEDWN